MPADDPAATRPPPRIRRPVGRGAGTPTPVRPSSPRAPPVRHTCCPADSTATLCRHRSDIGRGSGPSVSCSVRSDVRRIVHRPGPPPPGRHGRTCCTPDSAGARDPTPNGHDPRPRRRPPPPDPGWSPTPTPATPYAGNHDPPAPTPADPPSPSAARSAPETRSGNRRPAPTRDTGPTQRPPPRTRHPAPPRAGHVAGCVARKCAH